MRLPILPTIIVLVTGLLTDWYITERMRQHALTDRPLPYIRSVYIIIAAVVTLGMGVVVVAPKKAASEGQMGVFMWAVFAYFSVYIPKYLTAIALALQQLAGKIFKRRLRGISLSGIAIGAALFIAMWWGALVTRYSVDVRHVDVGIAGLPGQFEGYRIAQLSDIHTGTFGDNPRFLEKVVNHVNSLHPDIILFTGDIVNRHSSELEPFMDVLSQLRAPDGVWSVMGNHDYGEYYKWPSDSDRLADVKQLKQMQGLMGWKMLNNEHSVLHRGNDSIVLIGVENIGDPPFTTYGHLYRAYPTPGDAATKVLMTHNPAHWTDSIANHSDVNIGLTLSGHTHAMQIRLLGLSPAAMRYPTWGGLYTDAAGHALYVNIGVGEVGFPSRIGATPEITLITLHDKQPQAK